MHTHEMDVYAEDLPDTRSTHSPMIIDDPLLSLKDLNIRLISDGPFEILPKNIEQTVQFIQRIYSVGADGKVAIWIVNDDVNVFYIRDSALSPPFLQTIVGNVTAQLFGRRTFCSDQAFYLVQQAVNTRCKHNYLHKFIYTRSGVYKPDGVYSAHGKLLTHLLRQPCATNHETPFDIVKPVTGKPVYVDRALCWS